MRLVGMFLDTFFEIYALHEHFDTSRYRISHIRWRVCKLNLAILSRDYEVTGYCTFGG